MVTAFQEMIARHASNGLILDSNLLVLLGVGLFDTKLISRHRRTSTYDIDDFQRLRNFKTQFHRIVVTPHILAELSNLTLGRAGAGIDQLPISIVETIKTAHEIHVEKDVLVAKANVARFGFTDAGIIELAVSQQLLVLTDDLPLANLLEKSRAPVINFNHLRNFRPRKPL
jgi:rRNA-processing protein FCF1